METDYYRNNSELLLFFWIFQKGTFMFFDHPPHLFGTDSSCEITLIRICEEVVELPTNKHPIKQFI